MPPDDTWRFPNALTPLGCAWYYAVRFCSPVDHDRHAAVLAWYATLQDIAWQPRDPGVARLKLDWWRNECVRLVDGTSQHPLACTLHDVGLRHATLDAMHALIDAAEHDIRAGQPNAEGFVDSCRATGGGLFRLLAELAPEDADLHVCDALGGYWCAVERLQHLATAPQRFPAPCDPTRLAAMDPAQRSRVIEPLVEHGRAAPVSGLPELARKLTALSRALHKKIRRSGYPLHQQPIQRAPIAHLWTAWRAR